MGQIIFLEEGFDVEGAEGDFETALQEDPYHLLYNQAFADEVIETSPAITFLLTIARSFIEIIKKDGEIEITRRFKQPADAIYNKLMSNAPFVIGSEFITKAWLQRVYQQLGSVFDAEIARTDDSVAHYLQSKNQTLNIAGRVYFHLVASKNDQYPFAFMATYATGARDKVSHLPLKNALQEFREQKALLTLLGAVGRVAKVSPFISELVESGELFHPLQLTAAEAYVFLKEAEIYEQNGVTCRIPNFWKKITKPLVKLSIGDKAPSRVGADALLSCEPEIYIGDEQYSQAEILALLQQTEGLAFLKGKWVEINHQKLQELLNAFEGVQQEEMTLLEALRLENTLQSDSGLSSVEMMSGTWLESLKNRLLNPNILQRIKPKTSFKATLRPYQQVGYNWLNFMTDNHLGALLADDMGLGKTVQVLALLNQK